MSARIVVTEFVSLDGVMEGPGGDNDFARGAWSFEYERGEKGDQFKTDETMDADSMLLGVEPDVDELAQVERHVGVLGGDGVPALGTIVGERCLERLVGSRGHPQDQDLTA